MKERKLLYQADEKPPTALAAGIGTQYAILAMASLILNPALIYQGLFAGRGGILRCGNTRLNAARSCTRA